MSNIASKFKISSKFEIFIIIVKNATFSVEMCRIIHKLCFSCAMTRQVERQLNICKQRKSKDQRNKKHSKRQIKTKRDALASPAIIAS